jgi:hypothetical protein
VRGCHCSRSSWFEDHQSSTNEAHLEVGINGTASLTAIEEETHNLQTQTGSTNEVWQSQRNPKSNKVTHSPTPGTSSKQQVETLIENLGNRKRKGGSDDEHPHPSTLLLDTIIPRPAKRNRGFTGEHVKPKTTTTHQDDIPTSSSRNAASMTTNESEKSVLTNVSFSPVTQTTHGFQTRNEKPHNFTQIQKRSRGARGRHHRQHLRDKQYIMT